MGICQSEETHRVRYNVPNGMALRFQRAANALQKEQEQSRTACQEAPADDAADTVCTSKNAGSVQCTEAGALGDARGGNRTPTPFGTGT